MKNRIPPFSVRHQEFLYDDCDFHIAVMNESLLADYRRGAEMRGQAVAVTYRLPRGEGVETEKVCVKVIDRKETVQLFFDRWPEKSTVLKVASLPPFVGGRQKMGRGGHAIWHGNDSCMQQLVRFVRGPVSKEDKAFWNQVLGMRGKAVVKPATASAGAPRGKAAARKRALADEDKAGSVARMSGEGIGSGYLVAGKYWVASDFGRVVKIASKTETWYPEPFTCMVLKVLLENMKPAGLTSTKICKDATTHYNALAAEEKTKGNELPPPPKGKSLGQFFRVKASEKMVHPLFDLITRFAGRTPRYFLKGKWVARMRPT